MREHLARCFLTFYRLERCRGACPVGDVLVKVKPGLNLDHEFSEMCVQD